MRQKTKYHMSESVAMLYHLYRTRFVTKSDLTLYKNGGNDRYRQQVLKDHIKSGNIQTVSYNKCTYCFLTQGGVDVLKDEEKKISKLISKGVLKEYPPTQMMVEYAEYCMKYHSDTNRSTNQGTSDNSDNAQGRNETCGVESDYHSEAKNDSGDYDKHHVLSTNRKAEGVLSELNGGWRPSFPELISKSKKNRTLTMNEMRDKRRTARKCGVNNMMLSAKTVFREEDKPPIDKFLAVLKSISFNQSFIWYQVTEHGVYYRRNELESILKGGRAQGILFTASGWYMVFNAMSTMMRYESGAEMDAVKRVKTELSETYPYRSGNPMGIVLVTGKASVSMFVTGHKYGRDRTNDFPEYFRSQAFSAFAKAEIFSHAYNKVYVIEMNSRGLESLTELVRRNSGFDLERKRIIAENNPGAFELVLSRDKKDATLYEKDSGNIVEIANIYEIASLYKQRRSNNGYFYMAPAIMAEQISKCLATRLRKFFALPEHDGEDGQLIDFPRYNDKGERINE